jgi:hypothetical protein
MKACVVFASLLALVVRLSADEPAQTGDMKFSWVEDDHPTAALLRPSGTRLTDTIGGSLMREVERTLSTVGLDAGMELMHLKRLGIPAPMAGRPNVVSFKLTSYRVRNPRNAPDAAELVALDYVRTKLREGEGSSRALIQRIEQPGAPDEWRVYRPFIITPQCLLCHGPAESLQPQIRAALERHFPEDQAVNYGAYEWRGLIRITYQLPPRT